MLASVSKLYETDYVNRFAKKIKM